VAPGRGGSRSGGGARSGSAAQAGDRSRSGGGAAQAGGGSRSGDAAQAGGGGDTGRDVAVARFVERFAAVLVEAGVPRMPARVFAALLVAESGRLSAAELAGQLRASPAAVSGGVRYLTGVGMVTREGEPGSRRHLYLVPDDVWNQVVSSRDRLMTRWAAVLREGVELLGADTEAGARMADSVQYFEFVSAELPRVQARWLEYRAARDGGAASRS